MSTIPAKEIKRRGMAAVEEALGEGPVHIIREDRPQYVVLREEDYRTLLDDLAEARLRASEADAVAGRLKKTHAAALLAEIEE
jgi:PHD/YefM family antitoxin component YafN of YafNO toxin-antitoxin module